MRETHERTIPPVWKDRFEAEECGKGSGEGKRLPPAQRRSREVPICSANARFLLRLRAGFGSLSSPLRVLFGWFVEDC